MTTTFTSGLDSGFFGTTTTSTFCFGAVFFEFFFAAFFGFGVAFFGLGAAFFFSGFVAGVLIFLKRASCSVLYLAAWFLTTLTGTW
jgi:hypothetical protein